VDARFLPLGIIGLKVVTSQYVFIFIVVRGTVRVQKQLVNDLCMVCFSAMPKRFAGQAGHCTMAKRNYPNMAWATLGP
jgi:hypothetical protein